MVTLVTLVCGHLRDDVYYWLTSVPLWSSALILSSSARSSFFAISMWHSCLGNLSLHIFRNFLSVLHISFPEDLLCSFSCTFYNINKSHKLPFAKSNITSSSPLDVIFFDVWTSPVSSSDGFNYYVIFVAFKQLIENYFSTTIKKLYIDNRGEFLALRSFSQPMV